jgi:hypothetical protein
VHAALATARRLGKLTILNPAPAIGPLPMAGCFSSIISDPQRTRSIRALRVGRSTPRGRRTRRTGTAPSGRAQRW